MDIIKKTSKITYEVNYNNNVYIVRTGIPFDSASVVKKESFLTNGLSTSIMVDDNEALEVLQFTVAQMIKNED